MKPLLAFFYFCLLLPFPSCWTVYSSHRSVRTLTLTLTALSGNGSRSSSTCVAFSRVYENPSKGKFVLFWSEVNFFLVMSAHLQMLPSDIVKAATLDVSEVHSKLKAVMDDFGFAIVLNVLSSSECIEAERCFAKDLKSIVHLAPCTTSSPPGGRRHDPTADELQFLRAGEDEAVKKWPLGRHPLGRIEPAFASDYGIPHGRCTWYCRMNPSVRLPFEVLYNMKEGSELCVGLDVVFFNNNFDDDDDTKREDGLWPHADHSLSVPISGGWDNYQSIVYIWAANAKTSATVIWPRSHRTVFPTMSRRESSILTHYTPLPTDQFAAYVREAGRVPVPAGGMVIWNSRTIHQGWNIGPRLAVPVSFDPKARRSAEVLRRKLEFMESGLPTTGRASLGLAQVAGSVADGGDPERFPLKARAHRWLVDGGDAATNDKTTTSATCQVAKSML